MNDKSLKTLEYFKIIEILDKKAESSLGKDIVKKLLPMNELEDVKDAQDETDEGTSIILRRGNPPLGGIFNLSSEVSRAVKGGMLYPGALLKIGDSLRAARRIKAFIRTDREDSDSSYPILEGYIEDLSAFKDLEDEIENAIISEEEISDNASSTLRSIRRQIETKNASIKSKLNSIINSSNNKKLLQDSIITLRNDRYVVPVKQENRSQFPGLVHDQSSSGATLFIEPMAIVNLNNELKELKVEENKEIERILKDFSEKVALIADDIIENQKILAKIDFIFAKGKLALEMGGIKPTLNNEGQIYIKNGRHPLIPKNEVVANDIYLGRDFNSLIITGPNTGGKTVTLKTVGLLTLMTQAGLHIPSDHGSHMAIFNNVFADIGDEQSIEQSLSTFSSHMTNIVNIIDNVEYNSLVLFDELGAGTDPTEGAALAMSILDYLYSRKITTIATTHYSELKLYAISTEGIENASVEFDVESLSPTYKLLIGIPGKSNAFEISKRLGLQDVIIEKSRELLSKENIQFEDVLAKIETDRKISEENKAESERLKREINDLKEELENKKEKIDKVRKNTLREAKLEARKIIEEAKAESDEIIKELRNISTDIEKERNKKMQEAKDKLRNKLGSMEEDISENILGRTNKKPPKNLKVGDTVKLLNLNQKATVLTEPDSGGNLMVQAGIMKVSVNLSNIEKAKDEDMNKTQKSTKGMVRSKTKSIKTDLDLRGRNLEEAMLDVDKYLDDVYIAGLSQVTIIHGKGTGVLREGIKQQLKSHRHVKGFRLGKYGEGGVGVTVVDLK
ncbi:endonuclease MutS2 [Clostridium sp. D2Q-11]|uniref:Endonuclease MutS2 n=1 Tax=Anaeromonas frigoriresistens TaxID=2683708 RepID=A0A942Z603_9FIRM|nr:endonuclease MutS2 [Anaeromonas frigoriresistens]